MKLSEMRQLLAERDLRLTKSLGQNFLHDGNQLRRIVDAAELSPADKVLEIGPGLGPLTELLVERAGEVLAIEKDARLVEILRQRFAGAARLELVHADALEWLRQDEPRDWSAWKVVANLPYSVASPLLVELSQPGRSPERMAVTVQLEVARRILAQPGSTDYGVLTLLLQLHHTASVRFKIPPSCFFPPPDVDSACVLFKRRPQPLLNPAECAVFTRLVKRAFSQRRKMMLKLLKEEWDETRLTAALKEVGCPPQVRAEQVSIEQFCRLVRWLANPSTGS